MNVKNLTNNEIELLRSSLRAAERALSVIVAQHDEKESVITTIPFELDDVPVTYGELDLLLLNVICALNDEEDRRAEKC